MIPARPDPRERGLRKPQAGPTAGMRSGSGARFVLGHGPETTPPLFHPLTPPVGAPLALADVVAALRNTANKDEARRALARGLIAHLGVQWAAGVTSGRAALAIALHMLKGRAPGRNEVVIPAYTCFTIPAAAVRAGLRVRIVDLLPGSLAPDPDQVARATGPRTLALIVPHLLGYPVDLAPLRVLAADAGALIVDDAAQALGARFNDRPVGTSGDVGILSFGRGKPLTALGGGAVLCNDPQISAELDAALARLEPGPTRPGFARALAAGLYTPLLVPHVYWLLARLPGMKIGLTEYDPEFPLRRLDAFRAGLASRGLERLDDANAARRRTAERLAGELAPIPGITRIPEPPAARPIFLRFPVLLPSRELRDRAWARLRQAGIGASRLYPAPITAIPDLAHHSPEAGTLFPAAYHLAECLLCLPTYPHTGEREVTTTAAVLAALLAAAGTRRDRPDSAPTCDVAPRARALLS